VNVSYSGLSAGFAAMACRRTWASAMLLLVAATSQLQQALRSRQLPISVAHTGKSRAEGGGGEDVGKAAAEKTAKPTESAQLRRRRGKDSRRETTLRRGLLKNATNEVAALARAADSTSESEEEEDDLVVTLEDHTDVMPDRLLVFKSHHFKAPRSLPPPSGLGWVGAAPSMDASALRTDRIFVGGLGECNSDVLVSYFGQYKIVDAVVMRDKFTGRSRGFGFVQFDHVGAVDEIMQFGQPRHIDGRLIEVSRQHYLNKKRVEVKRSIPKETLHYAWRASQAVKKSEADVRLRGFSCVTCDGLAAVDTTMSMYLEH